MAGRIDQDRWKAAVAVATEWCAADRLPALAMMLTVGDETAGPVVLGRQRVEQPGPVRPDAIFLLASITKPIVAMGVMRLVERGLVALDDRVEEVIPEFGRLKAHQVTLRNLLTHTSGLPDMLPENLELRAAKAPLERFVEGACRVELGFPPGRGVQYQSVGFALLGEVIRRVSGHTAARFLHGEFFGPLGLVDTALGAPDEWFTGPTPKVDRIAEIRVPDEMRDKDWNWNGKYWRQLGVPWGGLLTTPAELGKLAKAMRAGPGGAGLLSDASIAAMTRNQLACLPEVPEVERRCRPWGLGWRLNWPGQSANFGDLLGPNTYGHWGATGTLMWIDPDRDATCVILTTQPQEPRGSLMARLSNMLAGAIG